MNPNEHYQVYFWITSGVLSFLITILLIAGSWLGKHLLNKIDEMIKSINSLTLSMTQHTEKINGLIESRGEINKRLDDHSKRINRISETQLKCTNLNTK